MHKDFLALGQLFMAGLPGPILDESTLRLVQKYQINNFIYFKRNVESPEQLKQLSKNLQQACRDSGLPPPLIAIDQEGGSVTRLPPPFTQFPDARILAQSAEPEKTLMRMFVPGNLKILASIIIWHQCSMSVQPVKIILWKNVPWGLTPKMWGAWAVW